jgi:hypothetical protein
LDQNQRTAARKATVTNVAVEKRTDKDGKTWKLVNALTNCQRHWPEYKSCTCAAFARIMEPANCTSAAPVNFHP